MTDSCFIVTIDGPSGAGKSTVAKRVAARLGFHYLDSGALYRAVGLAALEADIDPGNAQAVGKLIGRIRVELREGGRVFLDGRNISSLIRTERVSQAASKASGLPRVREALIELQRRAAVAPGSVVEGRDMGTVVFPHAHLKVFLDALPGERARRRAAELRARGDEASDVAVEAEMAERDRRDVNRVVAPLTPASDAVVIDSTALSVDEVVNRIVEEAHRRGAEN